MPIIMIHHISVISANVAPVHRADGMSIPRMPDMSPRPTRRMSPRAICAAMTTR